MPKDPDAVRILIIGAGSRGQQYAEAIRDLPSAVAAAIAEPIEFKRKEFSKKWIYPDVEPAAEHEFHDWQQFIQYEKTRRRRAAAGETVEPGIEAAFICILDVLHAEAIEALAPLGLHIMCEKPLATTLKDCLRIYSSLRPNGIDSHPSTIFGIGHVLRYSPHNMLLRKLLLEDKVIGEVISVEHTEPVGWWHFAHSYVRGNWRKESTTAPSLLTKSCHDIDFLLWLLCSPPPQNNSLPPHLPATISSTGHLTYLRKARKPPAAGTATNCLSCPIEPSCLFSAKHIYLDQRLRRGHVGWPVSIVNPEIEDCYRTRGSDAAGELLLQMLSEDYDDSTPQAIVEQRPWFGRCVWESDNDVCDDQVVTLTWDDDPLPSAPLTATTTTTTTNGHTPYHNGTAPPHDPLRNRAAKTATFHMIAYTEAQCERRGRISGTHGELSYDSTVIRAYDFRSGTSTEHHPQQQGGGHGGGDAGLVRQFVGAVRAVKRGEMGVAEAQREWVGCGLEEVVRSHAVVFAAEEARRKGEVVRWGEWWWREVEGRVGGKG
ncbi:MAG: hypothetical protein M1822_002741 [Bathelium mastoideum]|nr:MAG: hypothetical protein M1822_002741 [Bathelium mastoideum]